ncbi:MAG: glycosyl hydrolase 53 family protein [Lachnospiraceae bacterium]|nr:glycosyl hydrolase 53 family protein [Lachnospiraceae bacterium]
MEFIKGFDVSTLPEVERCGGRFFDEGKEKDALEILKSYDGNWIRIRVWNDPYSDAGESYGAGDCDLENMVQLAKRVKQAGFDWLLDLHYSDFWADPGKQYLPKAWEGMTVEQLEQAVYDFTKDVLEICQKEDILPGMVQVGNELSNGLMWPYGKVPEYDNIARFVKAGVRAVREFAPDSKVMIHLDNGGKIELYEEWFDNFRDRGGDWDIIGLSYYPFWHGTLGGLRANLLNCAERYGKELIIAEVSMGHTMESYAAYEQVTDENRKGAATRPELAAKVPFPMTPEGQADFIQAVLNILKEVPENKGKGIFWWEPTWIPVPGSGWANQAGWEYVREKGPGGNEWANQALFDYDGNALPALKVIKEFQA